MIRIDPMSRQPVYEQLVKQIERMILSGLLLPGEQLPSVRALSTELSINPNTIQKAYSELDARGISYAVPGIGCFIAEDAAARMGDYTRGQLSALRQSLGELALAGIARTEIEQILDDIYAANTAKETMNEVSKHD